MPKTTIALTTLLVAFLGAWLVAALGEVGIINNSFTQVCDPSQMYLATATQIAYVRAFTAALTRFRA